MAVSIRSAMPTDREPVRRVHIAAFGSSAEAELVDRLVADGQVEASLVAATHDQVIGHILFSTLSVTGQAKHMRAAALAPLAVLPAWQGKGTGSRLVREGMRSCQRAGIDAILVLGHPEFYARFGFSAALASGLQSPYNGPAFMALELNPGILTPHAAVHYPDAFSHRS